MTSQASQLEIHQALHGYSSGHRLLEASVQLPTSAQRVMVILSDLSGPSITGGFESYLTGYPVPGTQFYALAKTWYAPEMERPGCVWTHTLLLPHLTLASVTDLRTLRSLFRRPQLRMPTDHYGQRLYANPGDASPAPELNLDWVEAVIRALYSEPIAPVFLQAIFADSLEDLFMLIWSQQWPSLRRRFLFCTGSLSNRTFGDRSFDLQAAPARVIREIRRDVTDARVVDETLLDSPKQEWSHLAARAVGQTGSEVKHFLDAAAPEDGGREVFAPLVEASLLASSLTDSVDGVQQLIRSIAERFPTPTSGTALKQLLLGPERNVLTRASDIAILGALSETDHWVAFDPNALKLEERASAVWRNHPAEAADLLDHLASARLNALGESIFKSLVNGMAPQNVAEVQSRTTRLLPTIVSLRPSLAQSSEIWRIPRYQQQAIVEALDTEEARALGRQVVTAALAAGADPAANGLLRLYGNDAVFAALDWANSSSGDGTSYTWMRTVAANVSAVADWLSRQHRVRGPALAAITRAVGFDPRVIERIEVVRWLHHFESSTPEMSDKDRIWFSVFCLAIGLRNHRPLCDRLAALSFEDVHNAAGREELDYEAWHFVQPQLPTLPWWQGWDWCERLRRGLVSAFIRYQWPIKTFLLCTSDQRLFRLMLDSASDVANGKAFIRSVATEVRCGRVMAPEWQRSLLSP